MCSTSHSSHGCHTGLLKQDANDLLKDRERKIEASEEAIKRREDMVLEREKSNEGQS